MTYCLKNALPESERNIERLIRMAGEEGWGLEVYSPDLKTGDQDVRKLAESARKLADECKVKIFSYGTGARVGDVDPGLAAGNMKELKEALEVAETVGVDFVINVNLDKDLRLLGVFTGNMVEANLKAFEVIKGYAEIPLREEFDIVLTHSGYVGRDHYQTAKAGVGALPAVKKDGIIIIAANNRDVIAPVGSPDSRPLWAISKTYRLPSPPNAMSMMLVKPLAKTVGVPPSRGTR